MVRSNRSTVEARNEAYRNLKREKAAFSKSALQHVLEHSDDTIPDFVIEDPSPALRLWLERFPDLAATSLIGKRALHLTLYAEPHSDPLRIHFDREE
jgi:hypothetical protein